MGALDGRNIVVTGAGRGMGREHALYLAAQGAAVVVNDLGCDKDGTGSDPAVAESVAAEIVAGGGVAVANADDVSSMDGATNLFQQATEALGDIHGLVNNAGILRDRMFVNMVEDDWDQVIRGQLKSVYCPTRVAAAYWRDRSKAGTPLAASVVSMSSTSGLIGAVGQSNYGAAKSGIATLTVILAQELGRYGVRLNALTPVARTRMTEDVPGVADLVRRPEDPAAFDVYHPANVSPLVAWLSTETCPLTGEVFYIKGGEIRRYAPWQYAGTIQHEGEWTVESIAAAATELVGRAPAEVV